MVEFLIRDSGTNLDRIAIRITAPEQLQELIGCAQSGCASARQELLSLTRPLKDALVARMAQQYRLCREDVEDAQQDATFWVSASSDQYDIQVGRLTGCCFTTFLFRVISFRLINRVRSICAHRRRFTQALSLDTYAGQVERTTTIPFENMPPYDPSEYVAWRETHQRIDDAVNLLGEGPRDLWSRLCDGERLRDAARAVGISYDQAKRTRRRILSRLRFVVNK